MFCGVFILLAQLLHVSKQVELSPDDDCAIVIISLLANVSKLRFGFAVSFSGMNSL